MAPTISTSEEPPILSQMCFQDHELSRLMSRSFSVRSDRFMGVSFACKKCNRCATPRPRSPDAAQRAVLHGLVRCRAGAVPEAGVRYDSGSAKQHFVLHRA